MLIALIACALVALAAVAFALYVGGHAESRERELLRRLEQGNQLLANVVAQGDREKAALEAQLRSALIQLDQGRHERRRQDKRSAAERERLVALAERLSGREQARIDALLGHVLGSSVREAATGEVAGLQAILAAQDVLNLDPEDADLYVQSAGQPDVDQRLVDIAKRYRGNFAEAPGGALYDEPEPTQGLAVDVDRDGV